MSKFLRRLSDRDWTIYEYEIDEDKMRYQEAIFTLGNGYLGSRGVLEEGYEEGYAGTYIAGIYDKSNAQSFVIVNVPNPLVTEIYVDGKKLSADGMKVIEHRRVLDMRRAVLFRRTIFDNDGRRYEYESRRFFSLKNMHLGLVNIAFRSLDGDASVVVRHTIDGRTRNEMQAVGDPIKHYAVTKTSNLGDDLSYLEARTDDLGIVIGMATAGGMADVRSRPRVKSDYRTDEESAKREYSFSAKDSIRYEFQHYISVHTSRETAGAVETACLASVEAAREQGVSGLLRDHSKAWRRRWESCDIKIEGDPPLQRALRFDMYHLLAAAPPQDIDVSIAAKALSGEWYGGHVFWDTEIYMLPFFIYTQPQLARAFLMYRYRRLQQAIGCANNQQYRGALWPWESAESGEDETPETWVNFDGTILPVYNSKREHHIASDVIYAIYRYHQVTGDEDFMLHHGSEMIFETASFWASRVIYNEERKAYDIRMVIGPNEFQEGVDNNSYTNGLTRWMLRYAVDLYNRLQKTHPDELGAIAEKIGLTAEEVGTWEEIADQLVFLMDPDGLIEEFEGYFQRENVIIRGWDKHGMPAWPTEVALADVKETQLIKQGDVVLLLYLLSDEFSLETKRINFDYYEPRTTHMSSLSITPYAILATELGYGEKAYKYLHHTTESDLEDIHRNTERGVHAAESGGAWQIVIHGFAGLRVKDSLLSLNPVLHESWQSIRFRTWFRGKQVEFAISQDKTEASMVKGKDPVDIEIYGKRQLLNPGQTVTAKR
jgi:kojibiose phosphorylase